MAGPSPLGYLKTRIRKLPPRYRQRISGNFRRQVQYGDHRRRVQRRSGIRTKKIKNGSAMALIAEKRQRNGARIKNGNAMTSRPGGATPDSRTRPGSSLRDYTNVGSTRNATMTSARLTTRTTSTGRSRKPCRDSVGLSSGLSSGPLRMANLFSLNPFRANALSPAGVPDGRPRILLRVWTISRNGASGRTGPGLHGADMP